MNSSAWRIVDHTARLEAAALCGEVDLLNPAAGLKVTSAAGVSLAGVSLFKISLPPAIDNTAERSSSGTLLAAAIESFVRGDDLVSIHGERPDYPFRAQIYWRFIPSLFRKDPDDALRRVPGLELILSIQTSLLDSDPAVEVTTELPARQAKQLGRDLAVKSIELSSTGPIEFDPASAGCFQFAVTDGLLGQSSLSYIEMVHPADFRRASLAQSGDNPPRLRLTHRIFAERLEKGVILRSRLQAFFIPAELASLAAPVAYASFAASEPPLTV